MMNPLKSPVEKALFKQHKDRFDEEKKQRLNRCLRKKTQLGRFLIRAE